MCGIAGIITKRKIENNKIDSLLRLMKTRGPDNQNYEKIRFKNYNFYIFSSRLKIIDIHDRSNMPLKKDGITLIFNGEIYNYLELKKKLLQKGCKFKTNSDTEVLLESYKVYGLNFADHLEGMWACCIFDRKKDKIILSRDRFGEKPLFYTRKNNDFIFGSEVNYIKKLSLNNLAINFKKIEAYLHNGYKSIFKNNDFFLKDVKVLDPGNHFIINNIDNIKQEKYWKYKTIINKNLSDEDIIFQTRELLLKSIKTRTRSDVPISLCLSGGVDSAGLLSIIKKNLNIKVKTFSIIDKDKRYNEKNVIEKVNKFYKCDNEYVLPEKSNFLENLSELIKYHSKPLATITSYIYSLLMKSIHHNEYKVTLTGNVADELFGGYYDHSLLHLNEVKNEDNFNLYLRDWKKYFFKNIRNKNLKNPYLFIKKNDYRDHIFDESKKLSYFFTKKMTENFMEKKYSKNLMSNRMLNELFHETTPIILLDADHNSMKYSVENRNPFIDKEIFNFLFSIPRKKLINKGYNKNILREALSGYLIDDVRLLKKKVGFNSNIFNYLNKDSLEYLLNEKSDIFEIINYKKFKTLVLNKKNDNYISKFIFNVLNVKIFLEQN